MKTNGYLIYRLVLLASLHFSVEKVRDIAEDYEEYLNQREPSEKLEAPRQFFSAILREDRRYRPRLKTILAFLAAALLFSGGVWGVGVAPLSLVAVGLPVAVWIAIDGGAAARYSPKHPHAIWCVLAPFLCFSLLAVGCLLFMDAVVTETIQISPDTAQHFHMALHGCSGASLILFLVSACRLWRSSIWYFCPLTQAVSGWCFFRSIHSILTRMDLSAQPLTEHFYCLFPLILGLATSLTFALRIRKLKGRGSTQWMDK